MHQTLCPVVLDIVQLVAYQHVQLYCSRVPTPHTTAARYCSSDPRPAQVIYRQGMLPCINTFLYFSGQHLMHVSVVVLWCRFDTHVLP